MSKLRKGVRWRWAILIFLLGGIAVALAQEYGVSQQDRNLKTAMAVLATSLLLYLWAVLISRFAGRTRFRIFILGLLAIVLVASSVRITGVTGDLVPILSFRWSKPNIASLTQVATKAPVADSASFPQFLGPNRDGIITGVRLDTDWTANPPKLLWQIAVGPGWTGFSIAQGRAITQEQRDAEELVTCYDLKTGALLWSHSDQARFATTIAGEGPRSNPSIDGDRVFTLGANGILNCLDLASGKLIWSKDLVKEHAVKVPEWGFASAPLIRNGLVILNVGGFKNRSLVAHDAATGQFLWGGGTESAEYNSPTVLTLAGAEQIITFNASVSGHNPTNGAVLWSYLWAKGHPHIATPIQISTNTILVSSGYGYGSELLQISPTNNTWRAERLWKSNRLKTKFANLILHKNFVYGLDDGILTCLDPATGERRWHGERYGHGQLLLVGDVLLFTSEKGEVLLADPNPDAERIIARLPTLKGKMWNPPALAGEYLLVRNNDAAACYQLATMNQKLPSP